MAPVGSEPQEEESEEPSEGAFLLPAPQSNLDPNRATDSIIRELSEYIDHLPVPPIVVDEVDRVQTDQQDDPGLSRRMCHRQVEIWGTEVTRSSTRRCILKTLLTVLPAAIEQEEEEPLFTDDSDLQTLFSVFYIVSISRPYHDTLL